VNEHFLGQAGAGSTLSRRRGYDPEGVVCVWGAGPWRGGTDWERGSVKVLGRRVGGKNQIASMPKEKLANDTEVAYGTRNVRNIQPIRSLCKKRGTSLIAYEKRGWKAISRPLSPRWGWAHQN